MIKLEVSRTDGATRRRYRPTTRVGGPGLVAATKQSLRLAAREQAAGATELLEVTRQLAGASPRSPAWRELHRRRQDALARIGLAGRMLVELAGVMHARGEAGAADHELAAHRLATIAAGARAGATVYASLERPDHRELVVNLGKRLARRGLRLTATGPGWFVIGAVS